MKELNIRVAKTKEQFRENYRLHDDAIRIARPKLLEMGFTFRDFGEDRRNEMVWEEGEDKPDCFLVYGSKDVALIDWKGKKTRKWWMNERAYNSYIKWGGKYGLPLFVVMVFLPTREIKIAKIPSKGIKIVEAKDKNKVVEFDEKELISIGEFNKLK